MRANPILVLCGCLCVVLMMACGGGGGGNDDGPDLVPANAPGTPFYFTISGSDVCVYVRNAGTEDAGSSYVRVTFDCPGSPQSQSVAVPPLVAGATSGPLCVPVPCVGCWDPDCNFTITVDSNGDVGETDEGNNSASDVWIG